MTDVLTAQQIDQLLDKLSSDDDFRRLFTEQPDKALAAIGAPPSLHVCCSKIKRLASKEAIRDARALLQQQLTRALSQTIPTLDAG